MIVDDRRHEELLRQLIHAHGRAVRVFVARFEFDAAEAEEVVDDVFALSFDHIEELAALPAGQAQSWLLRSARYLVANRGRRNATRRRALQRLRRQPLALAPSPEDEFFARLSDQDAARHDEAVRETLAELDPEQQRILVMHACGYSGPEIARALDTTHGAARQRLMRAKSAFSAAFDRRSLDDRSDLSTEPRSLE